MPNQRAEHIAGYATYFDRDDKLPFFQACYARGISGNEAIQRFVAAVIDHAGRGDESPIVTVDLSSDRPETAREDGIQLLLRLTSNQLAVMARQRRQGKRKAKREEALPLVHRYESHAGRGLGPVPWGAVNWERTNEEIAAEFQVGIQSVRMHRRRHEAGKPQDWRNGPNTR